MLSSGRCRRPPGRRHHAGAPQPASLVPRGRPAAQCAELFPSREAASSKGPIFIPETSAANICINFPPRVLPDGKELKGGWRHDQGDKGACANGCCEFKPPTKKAAEPAIHPTWFETTSDCATPTATNTAPLLFQGKVRKRTGTF